MKIINGKSEIEHSTERIIEAIKAGHAKENRTESFFHKIKNNKILSIIIIFGIVVIGVGTFTDSLDKIFTPLKKSYRTFINEKKTTPLDTTHNKNLELPFISSWEPSNNLKTYTIIGKNFGKTTGKISLLLKVSHPPDSMNSEIYETEEVIRFQSSDIKKWTDSMVVCEKENIWDSIGQGVIVDADFYLERPDSKHFYTSKWNSNISP